MFSATADHGAVLADLVRVQPADAAVLIGLVRHRLIGRCDQTVGHIEMLMRRNGHPVLFMRRHRQDIDGQDPPCQRIDACHRRFLPCLTDGNAEQIRVAVGVTARPADGLVDQVVRHERLRQIRRQNEPRTGDMPCRTVPFEQGVSICPKLPEKLGFGSRFCLGIGFKRCDLLCKP